MESNYFISGRGPNQNRQINTVLAQAKFVHSKFNGSAKILVFQVHKVKTIKLKTKRELQAAIGLCAENCRIPLHKCDNW